MIDASDIHRLRLGFLHLRPDTGYRILRQLISLLEPGGVLAVQVLYDSDASPVERMARWAQARVPGLHAAVNLRRGRPWETPNMEGNVYDLRRVLALFREAGISETLVEPSRVHASEYAMLFARKGLDRE